ncbi:PREDICTED: uncharacterized protein LOC106750248 [Dinoponera quadriceps]|uniref:Uncharacterized protein LOC106750248 n=1 Tax=Dinoponera quadriceps TaxID=609295 RepID=A0A6P3Y4Z1_DINQU|nr:PREDICTED: uncharacterized protein LOC106750248 [Dinoponera quadriceps]
MGARLRKLKKDTKGLGGKGKLTAKLIDEFSVYYGLAIRRNKDSMPDMKKVIWATLKHKASTNEKPQHEDCPQGEDSWCTWQQAKSQGNLFDYEHKPALSSDVLKAITSIYEELSNENLLTRCVGGYTQTSNESLNSMIWSLAPKQIFSGVKTIDIASYCAASIFSEGYFSILKMMDVMNIKIGPNAFNLCNTVDERRISQANERLFDASKEGRMEGRNARSALEEDFFEEEDILYEARMGD